MDVKKLFGTNLRERRRQCGLSQEELAEKAEVSAKHIGALETGVSFVSAPLLESLSQILDLPIYAFFLPQDALEKNQLVSKELLLSMDKMLLQFSNELKEFKKEVERLGTPESEDQN